MTKSKILVILLVAFVVSFLPNDKANAQIPVTDGAHIGLNIGEWAANVTKWAAQIKEMLNTVEIAKMLQKVEALQEMRSLLELAELVDNVACLSSEYQFYLNLGTNYHCLKFLNFQKVSVNLKVCDDLLRKVVTVSSFFSMNAEGRVNFITQAKESLEKSAQEMEEYNKAIRGVIIAKSNQNYTKKAYFTSSIVGMFNRYNSM
jgi:hypothetical protein